MPFNGSFRCTRSGSTSMCRVTRTAPPRGDGCLTTSGRVRTSFTPAFRSVSFAHGKIQLDMFLNEDNWATACARTACVFRARPGPRSGRRDFGRRDRAESTRVFGGEARPELPASTGSAEVHCLAAFDSMTVGEPGATTSSSSGTGGRANQQSHLTCFAARGID